MEQFLNNLIDMGSSYGGKIVLSIFVAVIGLLIIKMINRMISRSLEKSKFGDLVKVIIRKIVAGVLYVILLIGIIEILGVPMSSVVAIVASGGLAVGLAFQGALSNLAGGFMILVFKPFKIGDYIESTGAEGFVRDISIFYTKIMTLNNVQILVPNGDLMSANVTNFSAADKRRIEQEFKITNDIDQDFVKSVLLEAAKKTEGVLPDPEPFARLTGVDDDTFLFTVRAWCETDKYWDIYYDLIENCSKALGENGIDDPEERIAVRLVKEEDKEA